MAQAAEAAEISPLELSFVGCWQIIKNRRDECPAPEAAGAAGKFAAVLREMARERLEPRRNRVNPRVVKQKMSKFKRKRPEHRGLPPLDRPFPETIVLHHVALPGLGKG
jgi:hypothetical protein